MKSNFLNLIAACILAAFAVSAYGIWYAAVADKSTAVADLQNQISIKTETGNRIASARAVLAEIAADGVAVQEYFIPDTGVVAFIDGLEAQGKAQGATVNVLSVSTGTSFTQSVFIFSLSVTGTFDAVMRTIGAIEYAPYDLSVSELSLVHGEKNSWSASLNLLVGSAKGATSTPPTL